MSDLRAKLDALAKQSNVMKGSDWRTKHDELQKQRDSGEFEIDNVVPGTVTEVESLGGFHLVRTQTPLDTTHGDIDLTHALDASGETIALAACDDELESFNPTSAVFVDTETTGLSGGTGTVAFLIGAGYFEGDSFVVEQCFMRDYDDEEPMLTYLDTLFRRFETIVTYNGKSFDVPLMRTRFIQNRIPFRLDATIHFDLVHAARRLWRDRLRDCSLGNVERKILGVHRKGDVPSHEIPRMWLDYLRTRDARKLDRVFYHHQVDIVSLAALTGWIGRAFQHEDDAGFGHASDQFAAARIYYRRGQYDRARTCAEQLLETSTDRGVRCNAFELIGFSYKRLESWDAMEHTWAQFIGEFPKHLVARIELAKHLEHRAKNYVEAERQCEEMLQYLDTRSSLGRSQAHDDLAAGEMRKRLERIQQKRARA
jgi:hypothetical protein